MIAKFEYGGLSHFECVRIADRLDTYDIWCSMSPAFTHCDVWGISLQVVSESDKEIASTILADILGESSLSIHDIWETE